MSNVTQADREAAASYMKRICDNRWSQDGILSGRCDNTSVTLAFAAHRIAAEKAQRERDAVIAEAEMVSADETGASDDYAYNSACEHIAAAIRSAL